MISIERYMDDGANWQAQAVLAYVRAHQYYVTESITDLMDYIGIEVGRFENCREQGYVFRLSIHWNTLRNYAVYEHRNSDTLVVLESTNKTINTPSIDEMFNGRDKYGYNKSFRYGQIIECGEYILKNMRELVEEYANTHPEQLKKNPI